MPDEHATLLIAEPATPFVARTPLVADCSVIAAVLFDEPSRDDAARALQDHELFAPDLIDYEMASVAVAKSRAGLGRLAQLAMADFEELQLTRRPIKATELMRLAVRYELTAYDAAYLSLAAELKAPLVTFDRKLGNAARRHLRA
jgi:predicted nucleic acid-binding protein